MYNTTSTHITASGIPPPQKCVIASVMVPAIPDLNRDLSKLGPVEKNELEADPVFGRRLGWRNRGARLAKKR